MEKACSGSFLWHAAYMLYNWHANLLCNLTWDLEKEIENLVCTSYVRLVHLNTGAAYHLCHSRGNKICFSCYLPIGSFIEILNRSLNYSGKFVAKNLTCLPCIGLSESRMRGVVHVLGILNNFFELYTMNIPALSWFNYWVGMLCFILFNTRDLTRPTILKEEASLSSILRPKRWGKGRARYNVL